MAIKKRSLNITQVAHKADETFVAPTPLPTNEAVRTQIVETTPAVRSLKKVCTIQRVAGFSFFTTDEDRNALDFVAFRNKFEKQNVVRAALHQFLQKYYQDGVGLTQEGIDLLNAYESTIYKFV